jgi:hypothetical protein
MDNEEYLMVQNQVVMLGNIVQKLPLKEFIEIASRADTVGVILDPTLWMKGSKNLNKILDLARALETFQKKAGEILTDE